MVKRKTIDALGLHEEIKEIVDDSFDRADAGLRLLYDDERPIPGVWIHALLVHAASCAAVKGVSYANIAEDLKECFAKATASCGKHEIQ